MLSRRKYQREAFSFLQKHLPIHDWNFSLPLGSGMETYFVQGNEKDYFVKVGVPVERYLAMAEIGLTPQILAFGHLEHGLSIMVQPYVIGRKPSRMDFQNHLEKIAMTIQKMHFHPRVRETLQPESSELHRSAGLRALNALRQKWESYKAQVPSVAEFVDNSLEYLTEQVDQFSTEGLVSSHGDICNANWLFASDGTIYLTDFDSMSMDDPALDMGALLWWYYPPELRGRFLEIAGYPYDHELKFRMGVRMAMHCLNITLPRRNSFDRFSPTNYSEKLNDFRAILNGEENPQGYAAQ